jgi:hypothetical protein
MLSIGRSGDRAIGWNSVRSAVAPSDDDDARAGSDEPRSYDLADSGGAAGNGSRHSLE